MNAKPILCLALVLSGGLLGCSTTPKGWNDNTSVQKVKFSEADLVGVYRMPIFSDRYVWLGRNGDFFTHFNDNYNAFGHWSLQEGVLIIAETVSENTNMLSADFFFRPLKTSGPGATFYKGLKFEKRSVALQWMQSLPREVPRKIGDLDTDDWFLRDSHANQIFINNCGTNTLQNEIPTEADIRSWVSALNAKKSHAFLSLGRTPITYIQVSSDSKVGFGLEYEDNGHYRAKGRFTAEEVVKALVPYLNGNDNWKKSFNWKQLKWEHNQLFYEP